MFQFTGFASLWLYIHQWDTRGITLGGFPHSGILGSTPACGSPRLIAANHALHRFLPPRHPPCALSSLTIKPLPTDGLQVEDQGSAQQLRIPDRWSSPLACEYEGRQKPPRRFANLLRTILRSIIASSFVYSVVKVREGPRRGTERLVALPTYVKFLREPWRKWDSNPRPSACKADALPAELFPQTLPGDT
jgi:hypothetical protein